MDYESIELLVTGDYREDPDWVVPENQATAVLVAELSEAKDLAAHWKGEYERAEDLRLKRQKELRMYEEFFSLLYTLKGLRD